MNDHFPSQVKTNRIGPRLLLQFLCIILISISCHDKTGDKIPVATDTSAVSVKTNPGILQADTHYFWEIEADNKSIQLLLKKSHALPADSITPACLVREINSRYENIKLQFVKISGDTVFVKIKDSHFLTQQMGSSGAEMYMTETTYNLTELHNIGYVHFNFETGDHASPGTYCRTDFPGVLLKE